MASFQTKVAESPLSVTSESIKSSSQTEAPSCRSGILDCLMDIFVAVHLFMGVFLIAKFYGTDSCLSAGYHNISIVFLFIFDTAYVICMIVRGCNTNLESNFQHHFWTWYIYVQYILAIAAVAIVVIDSHYCDLTPMWSWLISFTVVLSGYAVSYVIYWCCCYRNWNICDCFKSPFDELR
jgi:hypothetical protein